MTLSRIAPILFLACLPHGSLAAKDKTSVEVFIDRENASHTGQNLKIPAGSSTLQFKVKPKPLCVRYKLEGIDEEWKQPNDNMFLWVRFVNQRGDLIGVESFPATGRSPGWKGSVKESFFTWRTERVNVPPGAAKLVLVMSSAGPSAVVGIFAITGLDIKSIPKSGEDGRIIMSDSLPPNRDPKIWNTSGTHPSMAIMEHLGDSEHLSLVLVIRDDDVSAHADWMAGNRAIPGVSPGETIEISWKETYCTGLGGGFTATYERLPPGNYRFVVEDLALTGESLKSFTDVSIIVPQVFWKSFWFWGALATIVTLVSILLGRYLVRRRIRLHMEQERMIYDERRRIAQDLHDDIGTRISHISLLASHADNTIRNEEASKSFGQITSMSRDLIGALSETVWMLNPKNDDLESLVDFLYRLVSELCRLKKIRCRVDAAFVTENRPIRHDFRHNVSLAVKETVNNVLKHSEATELKMKIELEHNVLAITITDNGIGITEDSRSTGLGLESLQRRLKSLGGKCKLGHLPEGGLCVSLTAPLV